MLEKEVLQEKKDLIMELMNDSKYKPLKLKELAYFMQVPEASKKDFRYRSFICKTRRNLVVQYLYDS